MLNLLHLVIVFIEGYKKAKYKRISDEELPNQQIKLLWIIENV